MPKISRDMAIARGFPVNKWFLQTILFNKELWTKDLAREWLKSNKYKYGNWRQTINFHRFMQNVDVDGATYYTKKTKDGIELVFQRFV